MITVLAVAAGSILSVALVSAAIVSIGGTSQRGALKTVGFQVYWDGTCKNQTDAFDWGTMKPDTAKTFTVYIRNTGTIAERLTMKTSNWKPTYAQKYLKLSWDRENAVLSSGSNITATFTLKMSSNVANLTDFSFDVIITGAQHKS